MACILQINFEFQGSPDQVRQHGPALADAIAQVPGLVWKLWLLDEANHRTGGIYLFESEAAAEAYLAGEIGQIIQQNPAFYNMQIRLNPLWAEPSAVTAGSVIPAAIKA